MSTIGALTQIITWLRVTGVTCPFYFWHENRKSLQKIVWLRGPETDSHQIKFGEASLATARLSVKEIVIFVSTIPALIRPRVNHSLQFSTYQTTPINIGHRKCIIFTVRPVGTPVIFPVSDIYFRHLRSLRVILVIVSWYFNWLSVLPIKCLFVRWSW